MWYTILVALDVFLWWFITSNLVSLFRFITSDIVCLIPDETYGFIHTALCRYLPIAFVNLLSFIPNAIIFGLYMSFVTLSESKWLRSLYLWDLKRKYYFNVEVQPHVSIKEERLAKKQVVYAVFPHGVFGASVIFYFVLNKMYLNCVAVGSSLLFYIPIVREFATLAGARPANSGDIIDILDSGKSIVMMPGGLRELLHIHEGPQGTIDVYRGKTKEGNKPRKGFIRYTLDSNRIQEISIVPVYIEGGDKLYSVWHPFPTFQNKLLKRWYYPWPVFAFGFKYLPFWPKPNPFTVKFGKPIDNLDGKQVDEIFNEFIQQMKQLMGVQQQQQQR